MKPCGFSMLIDRLLGGRVKKTLGMELDPKASEKQQEREERKVRIQKLFNDKLLELNKEEKKSANEKPLLSKGKWKRERLFSLVDTSISIVRRVYTIGKSILFPSKDKGEEEKGNPFETAVAAAHFLAAKELYNHSKELGKTCKEGWEDFELNGTQALPDVAFNVLLGAGAIAGDLAKLTKASNEVGLSAAVTGAKLSTEWIPPLAAVGLALSTHGAVKKVREWRAARKMHKMIKDTLRPYQESLSQMQKNTEDLDDKQLEALEKKAQSLRLESQKQAVKAVLTKMLEETEYKQKKQIKKHLLDLMKLDRESLRKRGEKSRKSMAVKMIDQWKEDTKFWKKGLFKSLKKEGVLQEGQKKQLEKIMDPKDLEKIDQGLKLLSKKEILTKKDKEIKKRLIEGLKSKIEEKERQDLKELSTMRDLAKKGKIQEVGKMISILGKEAEEEWEKIIDIPTHSDLFRDLRRIEKGEELDDKQKRVEIFGKKVENLTQATLGKNLWKKTLKDSLENMESEKGFKEALKRAWGINELSRQKSSACSRHLIGTGLGYAAFAILLTVPPPISIPVSSACWLVGDSLRLEALWRRKVTDEVFDPLRNPRYMGEGDMSGMQQDDFETFAEEVA